MYRNQLLSCTEANLGGKGRLYTGATSGLSVYVSPKNMLDWISGQVQDIFMYLKSQAWPFQCRMLGSVGHYDQHDIILFASPNLVKSSLYELTQPICFMLWKK